MDTRLAAVGVVALVVLSGGAGSAGEVTTAVETAETTATTDAQSADLPPGVDASGVENASALVAAHRAALAETGYVYRVRYAASADSEFSQQGTSRAVVAKNHAPIRVRSVSDVQFDNRTERARTDVWANESVALYEYRTRNRTVYQESNATVSPAGRDPFARPGTLDVVDQASMSSLVGLALRSGEYEVAATESRSGSTLTTLRAATPNRSFEGLGNVSTYDGTLVVDERGRVHRLSLSVETERTDSSYELELAKLGSVVVEYPPWADRALEAVNADVDIDSTGNHFVVSNRGGDRLPPGTEVRVGHDATNVTLELDRPLAPGKEAYVYFPADGGDPVLAPEPPDEGQAERLDGEYRFSVVDPIGNPLVNVSFGFETSGETATPTE